MQADIGIIGGGIVGLATAYCLSIKAPNKRVLVIEKEDRIALHQSGRNSGVIHTGVYYKPGSLKAKNCFAGKRSLEEFCQKNSIPFKQCGKLILAVNPAECEMLNRLFERGKENNVPCQLVESDFIREREPHAAGLKAIYLPQAGIVDYKLVAAKLADLVQLAGGSVVTSAKLLSSHYTTDGKTVLVTTQGDFQVSRVVNAAGLQADRVAAHLGHKVPFKIVPFRGDFFKLKAEATHLCKSLLYPVPDPRFPFLGVHFTRRIDDSVECGPNAVLSLDREGYSKFAFKWQDFYDSAAFIGFYKLLRKHYRTAVWEVYRAISKRAFVASLKRLIPEIEADDIEPTEPGIRAQAVAPDGTLVDDFVLSEEKNGLSVLNAPSPAATSCLNIGQTIAEKVLAK